MKSKFTEKIDSPIFRFLIGKEGHQVHVHSAFIADLSPPFEHLLQGTMKEGQEKVAKLEEVAMSTFAMLCEYAYTGDYHFVPPRQGIDSSMDTSTTQSSSTWSSFSIKEPAARAISARIADLRFEEPEHEMTNAFGRCPSSKADKKRNKNKKSAAQEWGDNESWVSEETSKLETWRQSFPYMYFGASKMLEPLRVADADATFNNLANAFLEHARLYILADMWCVESLKGLVLAKIHSMLANCTSLGDFMEFQDKDRINAIVQLIQFIYDEDHTRKEDKLRTLLVQYVVAEMASLTENKAFMDYFREGGTFAEDLWRMVVAKVV